MLRISYTGTTDFLLSLDYGYGWFKLKDGDEASEFSSFLFSLRYYF